MSSIALEDTVILWDCSRSMIRTDFKPNRLRTIQKLVKLFIEHKIRKDPKDSIAIAAIGTRIIKLADFSNNTDFLVKQLNKLEISGNANIVDGIAFALQMLVKKIRHLGGANQRIGGRPHRFGNAVLDQLEIGAGRSQFFLGAFKGDFILLKFGFRNDAFLEKFAASVTMLFCIGHFDLGNIQS